MYSGYDSSPRNLLTLFVSPFAEPQAPSHTMAGKMHAIHINSYRLLMLMPLFEGMYGTAKSAMSADVHIQNAPFTSLGLNVRASNIPMLNGKSILMNPPQKFMVSSLQPTPIISYPDASPMKNQACVMPSSTVKRSSILVDIRRMNSA